VSDRKRYVVAITGASGTAYAFELIEQLLAVDAEVYVVVSQAGVVTMKHETSPERAAEVLSRVTEIFEDSDIGATLASGSFRFDALVVVPCSVNTIALIHANLANSLIGRCALVAQKEGRQIVIVPRETPFSTRTLQQLAELSQLGIRVAVAAPGFYQHPTSVQDIVRFVVFKVLGLLGEKSTLVSAWSSSELR